MFSKSKKIALLLVLSVATLTSSAQAGFWSGALDVLLTPVTLPVHWLTGRDLRFSS